MPKHLCTMGMFIIDEFEYRDGQGKLLPRRKAPQIGGGGTYAVIGARIFLDASQIGMVVDRGIDFPQEILHELLLFGEEMWLFRDHVGTQTTRALNKYVGQHRGRVIFEYLTPRIRITPRDLQESQEFFQPDQLHFICSPTRAADIVEEINEIQGWNPLTIYEPIPVILNIFDADRRNDTVFVSKDRCIPEELPSLVRVLSSISVLSPNSEEAFSLLSMPGPPTRELIQDACNRFLELGVGNVGRGHVIIRSGHLGAYVRSRGREGLWVDAYWQQKDKEKIVDVTGAGNAFLGGLSAGLLLTNGDVYEAVLHASISASFTIEQYGLPRLTAAGTWNHSEPRKRLQELRARMAIR